MEGREHPKRAVSLSLRILLHCATWAKPRMVGKTFCWLATDTRVSTRNQLIFSEVTRMAADASCSCSLAAWSPDAANNFAPFAPVVCSIS